MTIFGSGYRELEYRPTSMPRRLWSIAFIEFRSLFRSRWGTVLFLACQIPVFTSFVVLMVWTGFWEFGGERMQRRLESGAGRFSPSSPEFYLAPGIDPQQLAFLFTLVLTTVVTARSIAKDRAARALELLWTRGVTPAGYLLAKWAGSFLLVAVGSVLAPLLLWVLAQASASDDTFVAETIGFVPRVALALVFFVGAITGIATGVSALSRSPNVASILWVLLMVGTTAVGRVFSRLFRGENAFLVISPWEACKRIAEAIAGVTPRRDYAPEVAALALAVLTIVLIVVVRRRLRLEEAIA